MPLTHLHLVCKSSHHRVLNFFQRNVPSFFSRRCSGIRRQLAHMKYLEGLDRDFFPFCYSFCDILSKLSHVRSGECLCQDRDLTVTECLAFLVYTSVTMSCAEAGLCGSHCAFQASPAMCVWFLRLRCLHCVNVRVFFWMFGSMIGASP